MSQQEPNQAIVRLILIGSSMAMIGDGVPFSEAFRRGADGEGKGDEVSIAEAKRLVEAKALELGFEQPLTIHNARWIVRLILNSTQAQPSSLVHEELP